MYYAFLTKLPKNFNLSKTILHQMKMSKMPSRKIKFILAFKNSN